MSRISPDALVSAVARVRAMDLPQKERAADELFHAQPHVFASVLVQQQVGVSIAKIDFLVDILLICCQAMKESRLIWPLITEDEQQRQMERLAATVQFGDDLSRSLRDRALQHFRGLAVPDGDRRSKRRGLRVRRNGRSAMSGRSRPSGPGRCGLAVSRRLGHNGGHPVAPADRPRMWLIGPPSAGVGWPRRSKRLAMDEVISKLTPQQALELVSA
jgi:hypothetical protein